MFAVCPNIGFAKPPQSTPVRLGEKGSLKFLEFHFFFEWLQKEKKYYEVRNNLETFFQIQFRSSRAVEHMFKVSKGQVTPVLSIFRREKVEDIALPTPGSKRTYKPSGPQPRAFK